MPDNKKAIAKNKNRICSINYIDNIHRAFQIKLIKKAKAQKLKAKG